IDIPRLLLHLRGEITENGSTAVAQVKKRTSERAAFKVWRITMTRPWLYKLSARLGRLFQGVLIRDGKIGEVKGIARLATPLTAWTSDRDLRPVERQSFRDVWRASLRKS
ncbi:MAG TPA: lactate utilization protein LutB domain-containing protein, partial [Pyrinomonadaceae bacterium]